ncbi:uncharacterized protein LOC143586961 [Bidens hawaiensis]|uniref:uncharacterized protein LOC143586961 n=1 Tax=Bidens hawaiensis TaxID=980011 RepID=UPI0040496E69
MNTPPTTTTTTTNPHNNNNTRWTNPMHSMYWVCAYLLITGSQLIAGIVVLLIQRHHERLHAPNLYKWIIGYVGGCIAHVMVITWRFYFRNSHRSSPARHAPPRLSLLVDNLGLLLHLYYAGWYVMGGIWMSVEHTYAATDAPSLYRLSMVLLIFCSIGYAMPLIFCGVFFFCSPCVVLVEDMFLDGYTKRKSIRSLPTFKFEESQADIEPEDAVS